MLPLVLIGGDNTTIRLLMKVDVDIVSDHAAIVYFSDYYRMCKLEIHTEEKFPVALSVLIAGINDAQLLDKHTHAFALFVLNEASRFSLDTVIRRAIKDDSFEILWSAAKRINVDPYLTSAIAAGSPTFFYLYRFVGNLNAFPYMVCCHYGRLGMLKAIYETDCFFPTRITSWFQSLQMAMTHGQLHVVRYLLLYTNRAHSTTIVNLLRYPGENFHVVKYLATHGYYDEIMAIAIRERLRSVILYLRSI